MKRDWKIFFKLSLQSVKNSLIGLALVPVVFVLFNVNYLGTEAFYKGLIISLRIGVVVVLTSILFSILIFGGIYQWRISFLIRLKESIKFRIATGLIGMAAGLTLASRIESTFFGNTFSLQGISAGLTIGGVIYLAFVFSSAYNQTQEYNLKLRAESAEANMNVLKNQMQPHFLFNSLNSLAELIDTNREFASKMTQNLSDLYREILESSKSLKSSLTSELSIVQKYLELESLRFGKRLNFKIKSPENTENILIPSLILQTLVENAIKHGISQNLNGGIIEIEITPKQNGYFIEIRNTAGVSQNLKNSTGIGLMNTQSRLDLFYADKHQFSISSVSDLTIVHFWISGV
ncbi:MAG: histidine kinase [Deltaproteobacteria bacterium]|nr:histidine kinase [Deltaproteobacteria bacterium]